MDPINQPRLKEKSLLKIYIFNNSPFTVVNLLYNNILPNSLQYLWLMVLLKCENKF